MQPGLLLNRICSEPRRLIQLGISRVPSYEAKVYAIGIAPPASLFGVDGHRCWSTCLLSLVEL